ncbi:hypothetical protein ES332_A02G211900v1 [Gossypium tomentosum]|uniref:serine O-acetyltransferase n=1 Tax=Gossypium tomentosum TaxID=34277 RepID=A0A5D2RKY0_GOSTO|nr:hypothetical protein ES332_A02G211900v1 [Gossypium tomentosum]
MGCVSDKRWESFPDMFSAGLSLKETQDEEKEAKFNAKFPFEKVFPVYAMSLSKPDTDSILNSGRDPIWEAVREEAKLEAEKEPILSSFLYASILAHDCLEQALAFVLRQSSTESYSHWQLNLGYIFSNVMMHDRDIQRSIRLDVQAFIDRDPACLSYSSALLYLKGYHSLQSYRVAHALWKQGRNVLALALQSRISEVFGVDIHPGLFVSYFNLTMFLMLLVIKFHASYMTSSSYKKGKRAMCFCCMKQLIISIFLFDGLHGDFLLIQFSLCEDNKGLLMTQFNAAAKIGDGILLDHGTGVVIGETAVVGNRVSLMHGVTLGGTGKETGDRHPKVGDLALLGACVTVLGNIKIGEGAMIAAGSLVLKHVPPHSMVAGTPAQVIGSIDEQDPSLTMNHDATKEFFKHVAVSFRDGRSK